jgi:nucleoside-diphosphate-sugar epimerase
LVLTKKIGIVGGSSFLGKNLINELARDNFSITQTFNKKKFFSKLCKNKHLNLNKDITFDVLSRCFPSISSIVYISSIYPVNKINSESLNVNYFCLTTLAEWCLKKKIRLIYISTASVYINNVKIKQSEHAPIFNNLSGGTYALLKYLSENYISKLKKRGLKFLIIRPCSIYGDGQRSGTLLFRIFDSIKKNKKLFLFSPLDFKFNIIHVVDAAKAIVHLLKKNKYGTYNVGNYKPINLIDLYKFMKKMKIKVFIKLKKKNFKSAASFTNIDFTKLKKTGFKITYSIKDYIRSLV